jgi:DMSO/TMAO reductase YedYZ molybdopterin-dependent catalytic subunit
MEFRYLRSVEILVMVLTATNFAAWNPATSAEEPAAVKTAADKEPTALTTVNEMGKTTRFTAEALAKLPRQTVTATDHAGKRATYEGVTLAEVLRTSGVTLGKDLKGPLLANCLVVEAADNYKVVFSLPEIDPDLTDRVVLVADKKDGKPLDAKEGPYRLVVPHDKRHLRWVRQVTRLSVQRAAEIGADKKRGTDKPAPAPAR